jgi:hypothetical protein
MVLPIWLIVGAEPSPDVRTELRGSISPDFFKRGGGS